MQALSNHPNRPEYGTAANSFPDPELDCDSMIDRLYNFFSISSDQDFVKLAAAAQFAKPQNASELKKLAENLGLFDFFPHIHTNEELGRYIIQESGRFEYDASLERYYNYEGCGKAWLSERYFTRSPRGIVVYNGTMPMDQLMQETSAEQTVQTNETK